MADIGHPPCGGCGLKFETEQDMMEDDGSPSLRRVWVEIIIYFGERRVYYGHPPCGGCGLKSTYVIPFAMWFLSPSLRRVWVEIYILQL